MFVIFTASAFDSNNMGTSGLPKWGPNKTDKNMPKKIRRHLVQARVKVGLFLVSQRSAAT